MNKNLYGGISYPASSFVFDKVYNNYAEAINNISEDGILIGRYILVAYCDTALSQDVKNIIEFSNNEFNEDITDKDGNVLITKEEANKYYRNFKADNEKSYDRKVYRKKYKPDSNEYIYQEIASLNTTIGQNTIEALNNKIDTVSATTKVLDNKIDTEISATTEALNNKINTEISALIGGAPETLDTLKEIADWIAKDETGTVAMLNEIASLERKTQWQTF